MSRFISAAGLAALLLTGTAAAQPANTSLGTLTNSSSVYAIPDTTGPTFGASSGAVVWFSFTNPSTVLTTSGYLDINIKPGATTGLDYEMGLYTSAGVLVAINDDTGPGLLPQLSFGAILPPRGPVTYPGYLPGGAAAGQDGVLLLADTYYLAVAEFNATFAANSFGVTTTGTGPGASSGLAVELRYEPTVPVPEPGLLLLGATAAAGAVGGLARLRRRAAV